MKLLFAGLTAVLLGTVQAAQGFQRIGVDDADPQSPALIHRTLLALEVPETYRKGTAELFKNVNYLKSSPLRYCKEGEIVSDWGQERVGCIVRDQEGSVCVVQWMWPDKEEEHQAKSTQLIYPTVSQSVKCTNK